LDIEGLLKSLNAHSVRYVVIGATAFPVHGYARATLDLDLFIEPTAENAARAREALVAFGYDMSDVAVDEMLVKKILIRQYMLETDLHPFVEGATFSEVWARRVEDRIGETATRVRRSRRPHPDEGGGWASEGPGRPACAAQAPGEKR
jgi:hypothetical protein